MSRDSSGVRRLLFLSYWVQPRNAIGTVRSTHLITHLPKYGWDVTVVTPRLPDVTGSDYVQTGYWDLKGLVKSAAGIGNRSTHEAFNVKVPAYGAKPTWMQRLIRAAAVPVNYPDEHAGWLPFACMTTRRLLRHENFDAILSSAPPFTTHVAAAASHRNIPWIADLRDLWAEDDSFDRSRFRRLIDDNLERRCLSQAAALTVSSTRSAQRFHNRYPGKPFYAISTGYDARDWERVPFGREPKCTLVYAGTLYWGKRDPTMLFAALRAIFDEGLASEDEICIDFYAPREQWLSELVEKYKICSAVRLHGFIERDAVLAAQRRANRLVVLSWDGPTAEGVVAGKLFEYFGARRPILAIGGPSESGVEDLLRETGAGVRTRSIEQTKGELLRALAEHRSGTLRTIPMQAVSVYSGENCARRFASVLDAVATPASRRVEPALEDVPEYRPA